MLNKVDIDLLWLEIYKSHWSYQKCLTVGQSNMAMEEMLKELQECVDRMERTFE